MKNVALFGFLFALGGFVLGQNTPKTVTAKYITEEIALDGTMDEAIWETAEVARDFQQFFPSDQVTAEY